MYILLDICEEKVNLSVSYRIRNFTSFLKRKQTTNLMEVLKTFLQLKYYLDRREVEINLYFYVQLSL